MGLAVGAASASNPIGQLILLVAILAFFGFLLYAFLTRTATPRRSRSPPRRLARRRGCCGARTRPRRVLVCAAAALVAALAGVSLGAHTAYPGDPLWAVSTVLYSQRATSIEAAATLRTTLAQAQAALAAGYPAQAAQQLGAAAALLAVVRPEDGAAQLAQQQQ